MDIRPINGNVPQPVSPSAVESAAPPSVKPAAPVELADAVRQSAPVPGTEQVANAVKNLNKTLQSLSQGVEFSFDEDSNRTVVKIIDQETKAVLRQMPSEETLELAKALDKLQGLLIQQKA